MININDFISYPSFADAATGIYPHAALQYHARPKAKRGIKMLTVDKFPYTRKQTRGNEFIPWSNDLCHILKLFHNFKIPDIPFIWLKSSYKHSVTRSHRSGKESGRWLWSPLWRHQWRSLSLISHADKIRHEIRVFTPHLPVGSRVLGCDKILHFETLELTDAPTNLAKWVKAGHTLKQSRNVQYVQSRGPERAQQNNEQSWRSSRTDRRLSRQFWED